MLDIVIKAENLGKKYTIGHQAENGRYTALRDVLMQSANSFWHKTKDLMQGKPVIPGDTMEEVWALKDVSFEIRRGEVVGIIGRNGAGKSTLLKVLSRITEPSAGRVTIKGRVASLLEVGTGFHPELTGRENIFLNGAILGMTRQEIKQKFDEIVDFAEIEKFLDTPVKRYSSGMYVRLAFAVAAHLEPEILLVDEVLAVGDAQFQKKCLGKMGDVAREGRTILFVSHNMAAVESLCQKAILLEGGKIITEGESNQVINKYLTGYNNFLSDVELSHIQRTGVYGEKVRFIKGFLVDSLNKKVNQYRLGDKIVICIDLLTTSGSHEALHVNVGINTIQRQIVTTLTSRTSHGFISCPEGKTISLQVVLDSPVLSPGSYNLTLAVGRRGQAPLDMLQEILSFTVNDTLTGTQVVLHPNLPGFVQADSSWTISIA